MRTIRLLAVALVATVLAGCGTTRVTTETLPTGVVLPKDLQVPSDATLAVYLPPAQREMRFYMSAYNAWIEPGRALDEAVGAVTRNYFRTAEIVGPDAPQQHGLLLVLHPDWDFDGGKVKMTFKYRAYGAGDQPLLEGTQSWAAPMGALGNSTGFYNAALRATQLVVVDVLTKLRPDAAKFPAARSVASLDRALLVSREKPASTGTGFYINDRGQVLTAAHVLDDCVQMEIRQDGRTFPGRTVAESRLLDLAVLDTGRTDVRVLPLRRGAEFQLGESVTNVGYPLSDLLAGSPNLTRGNISSRTALNGSRGLFQFSAPIQPGSSGGPVVSDGGELLGVTVGTLNVGRMIERGVLPQNVNFALDARYVAKFLARSGVPFREVEAKGGGGLSTANEAALSSVVQIACFQ